MPRPDVSEARKAQILAAALQVFSETSYERVSMRQIIAQSGLSAGGVYWYFKSKEEILAALLLQIAKENFARIDAILGAPLLAIRKLEQVITLMIEQSKNLSHLYLNQAKYHAMLSAEPATHAIMEQIGAGYQARLRAIIEQGIAEGEFQPLEAESVAQAFLGIYEGLMLLWVISPQALDLRKNLLTAAQILLAGLKK
ncbi:MAG: TetR/AcrR family transcriptional regulator [Anaerolineae bacterium]